MRGRQELAGCLAAGCLPPACLRHVAGAQPASQPATTRQSTAKKQQAAALQKSEERLRILQAERATLTKTELESSTIDKQIAEERDNLAQRMNEAKKVGIQIANEQLVEESKVTEEMREQARLLQGALDGRRKSLEDQFLRETARTPEEKQDVERQILKTNLEEHYFGVL